MRRKNVTLKCKDETNMFVTPKLTQHDQNKYNIHSDAVCYFQSIHFYIKYMYIFFLIQRDFVIWSQRINYLILSRRNSYLQHDFHVALFSLAYSRRSNIKPFSNISSAYSIHSKAISSIHSIFHRC